MVASWLDKDDIPYHRLDGTGLVGELGPADAPVIGLRADLDALPIHDLTEAPWKSTVPGVAHACGHDVHTAALVGAAAALAEVHRRNLLPVRVRFLFQPAEEAMPGGALKLIARGEFPMTNAATGPRRGAPRVADGLVRLNSEGEVLYASPNALSCFHRFGAMDDLVGRSLVEVVADLIEQNSPVDESMPLVLMGRAPWRTDIEAHGVALSLRAVPLSEEGERIGAVLLCRDVSELRRRERELITKDATIREIHHRVKNNLQTVAALLRLQARRIDAPEAKSALEEAVRRVGSIAIVHETLSQAVEEDVDFDEIADRLCGMVTEVTAMAGRVRIHRDGSFGRLPSETATPLAMVLTEVLQNAVEHGFDADAGEEAAGSIEVVVRLKVPAMRDTAELLTVRLAWHHPDARERQVLHASLRLPAVSEAQLAEFPFEPEVQRQATLLMAARAREEAVRYLDAGNAEAARSTLRAAMAPVAAAPAAPKMAEEMEALFAMAPAAYQEADADNAVADDHHRGIHRVTCQTSLLRAAGEHGGDDQRHFNHCHRDGQYQGTEGLADTVGDDLGMMHGGKHHAAQHGAGQQLEQQRSGQAGGQQQDQAGGNREGPGPAWQG